MFFQGVDEAERVEDIHHVVSAEMVTIIVGFQLLNGLFRCPPVFLPHSLYLRHEVVGNLLLGDTAKGGILWIKADVGEVVENGEEGDLRKLGYAGYEHELFILVVCLQYGEYLAIDSCALFVVGSLLRMLQG